MARASRWRSAGRFVAPALLVFALLVPVLFYHNRYLLDLGILVLTYVMLGWGLNIVVGLAGLLDLGYVAFYAVGAYSYALLAQNFGLSFWICLPLAGILAAFWGVLLGFPVLRLRGDYLAIVTLAFGEIIRLVLLNWQSFTGGPNGISSIPRPSFFGLPFTDDEGGFAATFGLEFSPTHRIVFLFYLILALALLTNWVTHAAAPAADRPRLGGDARGRDRLPLARHQHHQHQAHGLRHRRDVRRLRRRVLRHAPGLHQPGILHLRRVGAGAGHRRARRHGLAARRRGRGAGRCSAASSCSASSSNTACWCSALAMVAIMIWRPRGLVATREPSLFLGERKIDRRRAGQRRAAHDRTPRRS